MLLELIAFFGSFFGVCCNIPQILKIMHDRDTKAISLRNYAMVLCSQSLWLLYGILAPLYAIIFWASIGIILAAVVIALKLRLEGMAALRAG